MKFKKKIKQICTAKYLLGHTLFLPQTIYHLILFAKGGVDHIQISESLAIGHNYQIWSQQQWVGYQINEAKVYGLGSRIILIVEYLFRQHHLGADFFTIIYCFSNTGVNGMFLILMESSISSPTKPLLSDSLHFELELVHFPSVLHKFGVRYTFSREIYLPLDWWGVLTIWGIVMNKVAIFYGQLCSQTKGKEC